MIRWSGIRSASGLEWRHLFIHTIICFPYWRIGGNANQQPYPEITISGYRYRHCFFPEKRSLRPVGRKKEWHLRSIRDRLVVVDIGLSSYFGSSHYWRFNLSRYFTSVVPTTIWVATSAHYTLNRSCDFEWKRDRTISSSNSEFSAPRRRRLRRIAALPAIKANSLLCVNWNIYHIHGTNHICIEREQ